VVAPLHGQAFQLGYVDELEVLVQHESLLSTYDHLQELDLDAAQARQADLELTAHQLVQCLLTAHDLGDPFQWHLLALFADRLLIGPL
jgi:hypothetical protein